jgi:hypothetical protein
LLFYQNERDGPNFIATPLRTAAAHVNDQSAKVRSQVIDALEAQEIKETGNEEG